MDVLFRTEIERELSELEEHLLRGCLCSFPGNIQQLFRAYHHIGEELWLCLTSEENREDRDLILMFVTSIQLICDIALRQSTKGFLCSSIADICTTLACNGKLIDYFLKIADSSDPFILFTTSRALSSLLILNKSGDQNFLDEITTKLVQSTEPSKLSFLLDVLKRIMEWKDFDEHTLEDTLAEEAEPVSNCKASRESVDFEQVKCLCITSLEDQWPEIVGKFCNLAMNSSSKFQCSIITFFNLWEAIISIKTNLSVIDTKVFYSNAECCVSLFYGNTPPIIWKHILSLLNEILCYGTTLALQSEIAEEPSKLACSLVRNINSRHEHEQLLRMVPYGNSSAEFGGGTSECDKVVLQRLILLVLKAVAITVKQASSDSSSDSSIGSGYEDMNAASDMRTIEKSMNKVLLRLHELVKVRFSYHPQTPLAEWIVRITCDQDDYMIESMLCCLDTALGLCYRRDSLPELRARLDPSVTFLHFLNVVSFDAHKLLDFLISNETCFLFYILKYLKYLCSDHSNDFWRKNMFVHNVMHVLLELATKIEMLVQKKIFPYDIKPIQRWLHRCEQRWKVSLVGTKVKSYDRNASCS